MYKIINLVATVSAFCLESGEWETKNYQTFLSLKIKQTYFDCFHMAPCDCFQSNRVALRRRSSADSLFQTNHWTSSGWSFHYSSLGFDRYPMDYYCSTENCRCSYHYCTIQSYCRYSFDSSCPGYGHSHFLKLKKKQLKLIRLKNKITITSIRSVSVAYTATLVTTMTIHFLLADCFLHIQQFVLNSMTFLHYK